MWLTHFAFLTNYSAYKLGRALKKEIVIGMGGIRTHFHLFVVQTLKHKVEHKIQPQHQLTSHYLVLISQSELSLAKLSVHNKVELDQA